MGVRAVLCQRALCHSQHNPLQRARRRYGESAENVWLGSQSFDPECTGLATKAHVKRCIHLPLHFPQCPSHAWYAYAQQSTVCMVDAGIPSGQCLGCKGISELHISRALESSVSYRILVQQNSSSTFSANLLRQGACRSAVGPNSRQMQSEQRSAKR